MSEQARLDWVCGPFERGKASIDESQVIYNAFQSLDVGDREMVMVDVGAHFGGSLRPFATAGWKVHAFEPDPDNRSRLLGSFGDHDSVTINDTAVTPIDGDTLRFFQSAESTGVSTLSPFLDSHTAAHTVHTRRLDHYLTENDLAHVDYLKVDAEGFDGFLLQSYPFHRNRPAAITCEFEDFKTQKLGYRSNDLAEWLSEWGYTLYVSQWHPIVRYGISHDFEGIWRYQSEPIDPKAWGNLIAVRQPGLISAVEKAAQLWQIQ